MFLFGPGAEGRIKLDSTGLASTVDGRLVPIFTTDSRVSGEASITLSSSQLEHQGIDVELFGRVEVEGSQGPLFLILNLHLAGPGTLTSNTTLKFSFQKPSLKYESLDGVHLSIKYGVKLTMLKSYTSNLVIEENFIVQKLSPRPGVSARMKAEIGLDDHLQVELCLDRLKFDTTGTITGSIYFIQVRVILKSLHVCLVRRERIQGVTHSVEMVRHEMMDGPAQRGDEVPLRLQLSPLALTSTTVNIEGEFAVKYALKLEFEDEQGNTFERVQEIDIWRRSLGGKSRNPFV